MPELVLFHVILFICLYLEYQLWIMQYMYISLAYCWLWLRRPKAARSRRSVMSVFLCRFSVSVLFSKLPHPASTYYSKSTSLDSFDFLLSYSRNDKDSDKESDDEDEQAKKLKGQLNSWVFIFNIFSPSNIRDRYPGSGYQYPVKFCYLIFGLVKLV